MKQVDWLRHAGIGMKLKDARAGSGLTTREVAAKLGTSPATISRAENGQRLPSQRETAELCALYGLTGEAKRELLARVAENADTESWLAKSGAPDELASLMELERRASSIIDAPASLIPGLLQTPEYARHVLAPVASGEELERRVALRTGRKALLSRPKAPAVTFFVEQAALWRILGDEGVMRRQLEYLRTFRSQENVRLRVVPAAAPGPANTTPFTVHRLGADTYVFVEAVTVGVFITEAADVAQFMKLCRGMDEAALDEQESIALIAETAKGMGYG